MNNDILKHIEENKKIKLSKILNLIEKVEKTNRPCFSDFLDPYEMTLAISLINKFSMSYEIYGGFKNAERNIVKIFNDDSKNDFDISVLELKGKFKFNKSNHRFYLGSIMNLKIEREKIGDINVFENSAQIAVKNIVKDVVINELKQIGKESISVFEIKENEIKEYEEEYIEKTISVASLRLDLIISDVYNISRNEAKKIIDSENAKVNFKVIIKCDYKLKENDKVSVKGHGRFIINKEIGTSKKDKVRINIKIIK